MLELARRQPALQHSITNTHDPVSRRYASDICLFSIGLIANIPVSPVCHCPGRKTLKRFVSLRFVLYAVFALYRRADAGH